jgi:cellulose synthase/poly-beta-1,6-N-acetylglucosamine synthase-like glycosyltransferase
MIDLIIISIMIPYGAFILFLIWVATRIGDTKRNTLPVHPEGISVIIPVKNEEKNIPALLESLSRQDYPGEWEILFVDDGSTDATVEVITRETAQHEIVVRCIKGEYSGNRRLTSKQQAIDLGIQAATFPIVALTDADMVLYTNWLSTLISALSPDVDLVFGHTVIPPENRLFTMFQSFQLEVLFAIASVFHYGGFSGSCMGNNMAIRKSAYQECGGFDAIGYCITEDKALLRHLRRNGRKTALVCPFFPSAATVPHRSLHLFFRQIARWAKGGFTNGAGLLLFGVLFAVQNSLMVSGMAGCYGWSVTIAGWINFLFTWLLIGIMFSKNRSPANVIVFPMFYLLLQVEMLCLIPALLGKSGIDWKGTRV